ncbi:NAD(P)H-binding protein [Loigolactobacillus jiayinensis]|uniref:NAD(P)H-binding protein n=1 Tax=Loigolactobacillus jiayinensis TaxID=2486016 RepID=A0ABW1RE17_9LACO|nr:NAD(P)H-binding protein [Loigolactobacillus jiayinensis]
MNLLVLAANGQIAQLVVQRILTEAPFKHLQLTLVLRDHQRLSELADNPQVTIVEGDITDIAVLKRVMPGQAMVYIAVADQEHDNSITKNVISAMQANGVQRVVATNILGIYNEVTGEFGRWHLRVARNTLKPAIEADKLLAASGLTYTTLRLPWLNDRAEVAYSVTRRAEPFGGVSVSRQSVSDLILKIIGGSYVWRR